MELKEKLECLDDHIIRNNRAVSSSKCDDSWRAYCKQDIKKLEQIKSDLEHLDRLRNQEWLQKQVDKLRKQGYNVTIYMFFQFFKEASKEG